MTRDLVRAWRQDFGIDVSGLFDGIDELAVQQDTETGMMSFEPKVLGDAAFYQALRRFKWYHPTRKLEHAHAADTIPDGARVVDIGAGNGDFASYLGDAIYLGLESDAAAVQSAQTRGRDLRMLSMAGWCAAETFYPADIVTAFQVLEHVADPQGFIAEMVRCAAPQGRLIIGVPDAESYIADLPDFMLNAPPHHVSWWTEAALRNLIETAGLKVERVTRFPVEPWEYQLWWMARFAKAFPGHMPGAFGARHRWRKIASFCLSWPLQWRAPKAAARGSTLLIEATKKPV
ncbi:MAG: class I SAM-dependent methyltransferase [Pseudomonadota bacterium]